MFNFHDLIWRWLASLDLCQKLQEMLIWCLWTLFQIVFWFWMCLIDVGRNSIWSETGIKMQGFPGSVTPDYVPFQIWDSLQVANPLFFESFHSIWRVFALLNWYIKFLAGPFDLCENNAFHAGNDMVTNLGWSLAFSYIIWSTNICIIFALGSTQCYRCWWEIGHGYWGHFSGIHLSMIFSISLNFLHGARW